MLGWALCQFIDPHTMSLDHARLSVKSERVHSYGWMESGALERSVL